MPPPQIPLPPDPPAKWMPPVRGDEDPQSPTVMLQAYLRSRGMPLTAENMQRVLTENARGSADIPGLVNDVPSADPNVGQSGNVAGQVEKARTPPVESIVDQGRFDVQGEPINKQPPASTSANAGPDMSNLGLAILGGAGAGLGAGALSRLTARAAPPTPQPGASVPPPPDPAATVPPEALPRDPALFPPGSAQAQQPPAQTGDRFDTAMNRAVPPEVPPTALPPGVVPPAGMPNATIQQGPTSPSGVPGQVARPPMPDRAPIDIPSPSAIPGAAPPGMVRLPNGNLGLRPSPGFRTPVEPPIRVPRFFIPR